MWKHWSRSDFILVHVSSLSAPDGIPRFSGLALDVQHVQTFVVVCRSNTKEGPLEGKTPSDKLNLQSGELVQIKSHEEILNTLDKNNKNRGLWFDAEQVPYCGKTAKVLCRVEKIINERTGKMMKLPNDCLILEGVYCRAHYSSDRLFCPRSIYSYWREIWLKRVTH